MSNIMSEVGTAKGARQRLDRTDVAGWSTHDRVVVVGGMEAGRRWLLRIDLPTVDAMSHAGQGAHAVTLAAFRRGTACRVILSRSEQPMLALVVSRRLGERDACIPSSLSHTQISRFNDTLFVSVSYEEALWNVVLPSLYERIDHDVAF